MLFVYTVRTWLNSESDSPPDLRFRQRLKSVRQIALAFFVDGSSPKAVDRGTQALKRLVPQLRVSGRAHCG
jgi:hypothetical protein